jgi:lysophospholipase L1-like esterase
VATHNAWTKENYPKKIAGFKTDPLQLHDVVFLGNSITQLGGDWGTRLGNAIVRNRKTAIRNRGIAGDVTDGVIARLGEITYVKPTAVFLEIGINDLFNDTLSAERTAANIIRITELIHRKSPRTRIFVQTVFPTDRDPIQLKVNETNRLIHTHKTRNFTILETHDLFTDNEGKMRKDLSTDGVHLNEKGYAVWVDYLKPLFN